MTHSLCAEDLGGHEAALKRADAYGYALFAGLPKVFSERHLEHSQPVPRAFLPLTMSFVDALLDAEVTTPEGLVSYLTASHPKSSRLYAQAIWNALTIVNVAMTGQPNWEEIYAKIGAGGDSPGESGNESEHTDTDDSADNDDFRGRRRPRFPRGHYSLGRGNR